MKNQPVKNNSKQIYSTYNFLSSGGLCDNAIIENLLSLLKKGALETDLTLTAFLSEFYIDNELDLISVIELIGLTHQKRKEKQTISRTDERKHNGIYYTNYSIARRIAEDTILLYKNNFDPTKLTFLEPCCGTGIFALAYLDVIFKLNKNYLPKAQQIINNMYFADIDGEAISLLKSILTTYLEKRYFVKVYIPETNLYVGDVLFTVKNGELTKTDLKTIFNKKDKFDIVLTNPPYKLLKANSNKYNEGTDNYKKDVTEILSYIRKHNVYKYNSGTLNLYKLFLEEILENYTNKEGKIGILIPSTLLTDKQSYELRNRILNSYTLSTIYTIPEKNNFFVDIRQAFCFFSVNKSELSNDLFLKMNISDTKELDNNVISVTKTKVSSISTLQEIVSTDNIGWQILEKIHKYNKLKDFPSISNLRGELDLTIDKRFITNEGTEYNLLRGNGIKEFALKKDNLYVDNKFINKLNGKAKFLLSERIACQQISNINLAKRLKFTKVPKKIVLGNSCNFIVKNSDALLSENNISLHYLLGILNSFLLNWRFKLTSSNNHIGNYELDELPIALPSMKQKAIIEDLVGKLTNNPNNNEYGVQLNATVFDIYGLTLKESLYILDKHRKHDIAEMTGRYIYQV